MDTLNRAATQTQQFPAPRQLFCSEPALTLKLTKEEMTLLNFFPAVLNEPHLKAVATSAHKSRSSVTTETNTETLAICSLVFSRKFTYELHTKFHWSDKLFWTHMKKILLLHYHSPLAILYCILKKPVHLKPASVVVSPSLALSLCTETEVWK